MIGIFDSGSGGLSVFREIFKVLPSEKYVYFSDNAWCPYGEKSREFIIGRAREISRMLIGKGCQAIVVACNTATAAAISTLREEFDIPFIGMEPAIKPAANITRSKVVGVLATAGTLGARKYHDTRDRFAEGVSVVEHVGKGFVELVENGILNGPEAEETVSESLRPLLEAGADTIVLGCTHYPFLKDCITTCAGRIAPDREVTIIDPAPAVARQLLRTLGREIPDTDPAPAVARQLLRTLGTVDTDSTPGITNDHGNQQTCDNHGSHLIPGTSDNPDHIGGHGNPDNHGSHQRDAEDVQGADIELLSSGDITSLTRIFAIL